MEIVRVEKTRNYTVMSNYHFKEKDMSLKAKGLLSLMLSLPEDWNYSIEGLTKLCKDGKDSVMSAVKEIIGFGYLQRIQKTDDSGKYAGYDYVLYEKPNTEEPKTGKPNTENPQQLNTIYNKSTIIIKEKEEYKEEKEKQGVALNSSYSICNKATEEDYIRWFENTYSIYPRKVSKVQSKKTYIKKLQGLDYESAYKKVGYIYKLLKRQIQTWQEEDRKLEYIPHFSSWLNANIEDSKK